MHVIDVSHQTSISMSICQINVDLLHFSTMPIIISKASSSKKTCPPAILLSLWPSDEEHTMHERQKDMPSLPLHTPDRRTKAILDLIKEYPKDADRYVLAGALYETSRWYSAALDIYQCAMIHIPSTHARYGELQDGLQRVHKRLGSFIHLLPPYLLNIIFGHLRNLDLIHCMYVNQVWRRYILQWPHLWHLRSSVIDHSIVDFFLDGKGGESILLQGCHDVILLFPILKLVAAKDSLNIKSLRDYL